MNNKSKKNPLSEKIFDFIIERGADILNNTTTLLFDPQKAIRNSGFCGIYGNSYYCFPKEIANLKRSPYFKENNGKFYITRAGREKIIRNVIKNKKNKEKWRGKWLAVAFDMPEATRKERDFLRRELKWLGLREFQHSIWITPWDIEKELMALLHLWGKDFNGDIKFMKIDKITQDENLKKLFEIN